MAARRPPQRRTYTVEEANAALPLVGAIVADLARVSREVIERRERLSVLLAGRDADSSDPYREELVQIEEEVAKDRRRVRGYVEELEELGLEPRNNAKGVVDFPALMDGSRAALCWKLGEPEVIHWHEPGGSFQSRRPVAAGSVSDCPPVGECH